MGVRDDIAKAVMRGIRAFHSSPHDFERFDLSKIGTGEGAQVYGHGIYAAENPAVSGQGGQYWQQFQPRFQGAEYEATQHLLQNKFDRAAAAKEMETNIAAEHEILKRGYLYRGAAPMDAEEIAASRKIIEDRQQVLDRLRSGAPVGPRTYEVNINADPAHMLDWDKALQAQAAPVKSALTGALDERYGKGFTSGYIGRGADYRDIHQNFDDLDPARLSAMLNERGVPGIKYLDEGSRGRQFSNKNALFQEPLTSNYVVFDPANIDILKKYGVAGAAAVPVMGAIASQDQYQPEEAQQ